MIGKDAPKRSLEANWWGVEVFRDQISGNRAAFGEGIRSLHGSHAKLEEAILHVESQTPKKKIHGYKLKTLT